MSAQAVLIEDTSQLSRNSSGLLFGNKYVLATSHSFLPVLRACKINFNGKHDLIKYPESDKAYKIITQSVEKSAKLTYYFVSEDVSNAIEKEIKDWDVSTENAGTEYETNKLRTNTLEIKRDQRNSERDLSKQDLHNLQILLSVFCILEIVDECTDTNTKPLLHHLHELWQESKHNLCIGHNIMLKCTPFGLRHFLNTQSKGIISNVFGTNSSLLVLDYPGVPGCEGGPIFSAKYAISSKDTFSKNIFSKDIFSNYNGRTLGVILCCIKGWRDSSIGLVIGIKLDSLLYPLIKSKYCSQAVREDTPLPRCDDTNILMRVTQNSLARVICGSSWGTAVLLDKNQGIFITASHVVEGPSMQGSSPYRLPIRERAITLQWKDKTFKAKILYQTPNDKIFDLAICKVTCEDFYESSMEAVVVSSEPLNLGEPVWAAGFTLFSKNYNNIPTLTKGHVSKIRATLVNTTCTVLAGMSGGALLREGGKMVGVIVANISFDELKYPKINMVVPAVRIFGIIEEFLKTNDRSVLNELEVNSPRAVEDWTFVLAKL